MGDLSLKPKPEATASTAAGSTPSLEVRCRGKSSRKEVSCNLRLTRKTHHKDLVYFSWPLSEHCTCVDSDIRLYFSMLKRAVVALYHWYQAAKILLHPVFFFLHFQVVKRLNRSKHFAQKNA